MTLHALRLTIGDRTSTEVLRQWAARDENTPATTADLIALAERVSGKQLDELFQDWLYTPGKPGRPPRRLLGDVAPAVGPGGRRPNRRDRGRAGFGRRGRRRALTAPPTLTGPRSRHRFLPHDQPG